MPHIKLNLLHASHICMYQFNPFGWQPISPSIIFPNATSVALIDCNPFGISALLRAKCFPRLERIYYLSGKPHFTTIHKRFDQQVKWIFPNQDYYFYNCMTEAGFGEKSNDLILSYILRKKLVAGAVHFDINLPDYGPICGAYYRNILYHHMEHTPISIPYNDIPTISACRHPVHQYQRSQLEIEFMKHITLQN